MGFRDWFNLSADSGAVRDATDDRYFGGQLGMSEIEVTVTVERARQVPVVRDCLHLLAGSVAGLEFGVFGRRDEHNVERLDQHPIARLLRNPNPRMTSYDLVYAIVDDLCAHGDFYAQLVFDVRGDLVELKRLDPDRTSVEETVDETKRFRVTRKTGVSEVLLEDEVWHIPLPPLVDGIKGRSPILDDGLEAIAVAIALQRYANKLFSNDATPPYALMMESSFSDQASKKNFLDAWSRWVTGRNRGKPGILEYGLKPHRMGLAPEEAQFLETRKELWLDLTRIWGIPPHKVANLERATNNNIEHQALEFVTDTLRPLLELIERSIAKFLIGEPDVYFEFNVESLLRGDIKARYEAYALGRQWGWLSVNDILRLERRNGIGPSGDRYIEPLNMVPAGTAAQPRERDARASIDKSIAFLRDSVARNGGRPKLKVIRNAA